MATYGVKPLRKIQYGREATAGTAVAATVVHRGPATMPKDTRKVIFAAEDVGRLTPSLRVYTPLLGAEMAWDSHEATFEHLPHVLEGGIDAETPTQDGAGSDYIRVYTLGASGNYPKTYTLEGGDNVDVGEMEFAFVKSFSYDGKYGESVMVSAVDWQARQWTDTSFTGALTPTSVEEILFNKGTIFINDVASAFGTDQAVGTLLGFKVDVDTGWRIVPVADGSLYYLDIKNVGPSISVEITMEHDSVVSVAEKAKFRALTSRALRLQFEGSAFGTAGTTYSVQTHLLDVCGVWDEGAFEMGEQDGDNIMIATLRGGYDATRGFMAQFTHVNEVAAL